MGKRNPSIALKKFCFCHADKDLCFSQSLPIGSMYHIFTYIYHKNQPNVGYTMPYAWILWVRQSTNRSNWPAEGSRISECSGFSTSLSWIPRVPISTSSWTLTQRISLEGTWLKLKNSRRLDNGNSKWHFARVRGCKWWIEPEKEIHSTCVDESILTFLSQAAYESQLKKYISKCNLFNDGSSLRSPRPWWCIFSYTGILLIYVSWFKHL